MSDAYPVNIFDIDLAGIFSFTVSPLELMLRGTLMYWFLFIVLRFVARGRREPNSDHA